MQAKIENQDKKINELQDDMNMVLHNLENGLVYEAYRQDGTSDYFLLEPKKIDGKTARKLIKENEKT
jgi:hypothetical protein